ncbi:hypothetical protein A5647_13440 [Mycobacterium sp. 1100029.7]|nr:hypothetical protein A5647_13440 [Mycobacterium sp. 1100029.7]
MELRQLEAFVAVATELHFGRAAQKLHMGQPTLSDLIRRLERELGTQLLTRNTRRVALTAAGAELLDRARLVLDDVASAATAVQRLAQGDAGTVQVGIAPPVGSVLAPHLAAALRAEAPEVELSIRRMWLGDLNRAVAEGTVDVAITCGLETDPPEIVRNVFCGELLQVGLRTDHRLAGRDAVALNELADEILGLHSTALFPAWALVEQQALGAAGVSPPTTELVDSDLSACHWAAQSEVDWILTTDSIAGSQMPTPMLPVTPLQVVPYVLRWNPERASEAAVSRFVQIALTADVPPNWVTLPDHARHRP